MTLTTAVLAYLTPFAIAAIYLARQFARSQHQPAPQRYEAEDLSRFEGIGESTRVYDRVYYG